MLSRQLPVVWGQQHLWRPKTAEVLAKSRKSRLFHSLSRLCKTSGTKKASSVLVRLDQLELVFEEVAWDAHFEGKPGAGRWLEQIYVRDKG